MTEAELEEMKKISYASAVGCLMYAMVCTRPDLAQALSVVSKYTSIPGRDHWQAIMDTRVFEGHKKQHHI